MVRLLVPVNSKKGMRALSERSGCTECRRQVSPAAFSWCGGGGSQARAKVAAEHTRSEKAGVRQGERPPGCPVGRSRRETREERVAAGEKESRHRDRWRGRRVSGSGLNAEQSITKGPGETPPPLASRSP